MIGYINMSFDLIKFSTYFTYCYHDSKMYCIPYKKITLCSNFKPLFIYQWPDLNVILFIYLIIYLFVLCVLFVYLFVSCVFVSHLWSIFIQVILFLYLCYNKNVLSYKSCKTEIVNEKSCDEVKL